MKVFPWLLACITVIIAVLACKNRSWKKKQSSGDETDGLTENAQNPAGFGEIDTDTAQVCKDPYLPLESAFFGPRTTGATHRVYKSARPTPPHSLPWTVLLLMLENTHVRQCIAALIALDEAQTESDLIITAAHCVAFIVGNSMKVRHTTQILAVAGKHDIARNETGEQIRFAAHIANQGFDADTLYNDFVLIKLESPIKFSRTIQPLYLPYQDEQITSTARCNASGWGFNGYGYLLDLNDLPMEVQEKSVCEAAWNSIHMYYKHPEMLCARPHPRSADLCHGDDGAPLACDRPKTLHSTEQQWKLFGVFSFTFQGSCQNDADSYPVFANLPLHSNYLKSRGAHMTAVGKLQSHESDRPALLHRAPGFRRGQEDRNCGQQSVHHPQNAVRSKRIIGGNIANPHSWPWQVYIRVTVDTIPTPPITSACGASLIRVSMGDKQTDVVVTAAHCVTFKYAGRAYKYHPTRIEILAGKHDILNDAEVEQKGRFADKIVVHPEYKPEAVRRGKTTMNLNDIALVRLNKPVVFNDAIQPICRPTKRTDQVPFDSEFCVVTGWGYTDEISRLVQMQGPSARYLRQCKTKIFTADECTNNPGGWSTDLFRYPEMLCSGSMDRPEGTCAGDSGGPVKCLVHDRWFLFGILSFRNDTDSCFTPGYPPIFMSAVYYAEWIQDEAETLTTVSR